ncbi:probable receptor-like protein kinase At1g49730 isoform X2 [Hordeum vulgare subsp. vulgare]|uniref:probable receptor-like protein kinase At1g49730 isoform X2 n=1 Tax=Hordeum vulgare subsp. vulgare TaxID=112509 RepID=UPI001D1A3502|nr:probable receptor-like protein kinase At1g49730 isoform X2 [Hordeum vulgare subsp. vulgare]
MGCLHQRLGRTRALPFVRRFKPREIEAATSGFSTALETGGPRGTAYRARFADGLVATVRRAGGGDPGQEDHFYRELQLLGRLNHRHVVRLRGFSEGHTRFLVFDQMENRSLKECLHDPLRTPLNWRTRLQVAIDVAAALEYLYYFCDPPVFHVTVNSSNVMMDADFVAKVSHIALGRQCRRSRHFGRIPRRRANSAEAGGAGVPVRRVAPGARDRTVARGRQRGARAVGAGARVRRIHAEDGGRGSRRHIRRRGAPGPRDSREALH